MIFHFTCNEQVRTTNYMVDLMKHTILQLVVHTCDERVRIDDGLTRDRVDAGIDVTTKHGVDGHTILHVDSHYLG